MDFNVKDIKKNIGVSAIQQAYGGISYYHLDRAIVITNLILQKPLIN